MSIKRDRPNQVGAQRGENQHHVRNIEQREKQKKIGQEAAPHDEFSVAAEIQKRIRPPTLRLLLPDSQELLRTSIGQPMPLKSGHQEAQNRSKDKQATPAEVSPRARAPH